MAKVGMAWTTDLRRISLPTYDNNFSFQPYFFPHTQSLMKFKLALLFFPTTTRNPKYFAYSLTSGTPRTSWIECFVAVETFVPKNRVVLDLSTCYPEALSYLSRPSHISPKYSECSKYLPFELYKRACYHLQKLDEKYLGLLCIERTL